MAHTSASKKNGRMAQIHTGCWRSKGEDGRFIISKTPKRSAAFKPAGLDQFREQPEKAPPLHRHASTDSYLPWLSERSAHRARSEFHGRYSSCAARLLCLLSCAGKKGGRPPGRDPASKPKKQKDSYYRSNPFDLINKNT
ncbi:MAG TPA: hypothetical protein PLU86_10120 [Comamonas denitrificans]|nr:hypothetical protein [Comamonas denitrificans]